MTEFHNMVRATINGISCILFYDERVQPEKGDVEYLYPYVYHLRHDEDDWCRPISIERYVFINFFGTVFMKEPLDFDESGYIEIEDFEMESNFIKYRINGTLLEKVFNNTLLMGRHGS